MYQVLYSLTTLLLVTAVHGDATENALKTCLNTKLPVEIKLRELNTAQVRLQNGLLSKVRDVTVSDAVVDSVNTETFVVFDLVFNNIDLKYEQLLKGGVSLSKNPWTSKKFQNKFEVNLVLDKDCKGGVKSIGIISLEAFNKANDNHKEIFSTAMVNCDEVKIAIDNQVATELKKSIEDALLQINLSKVISNC